MKIFSYILLLLLCSVLLPLPLEGADLSNNDTPVIEKLAIDGATDKEIKAIKKGMSLPLPTWKSKIPFTKQPEFSREALEKDLDRIRKLYRTWGYYEAIVTSKVTENRKKNTVTVQIHIIPGPAVLVAKVDVEGIAHLNNELKAGIREKIRLAPGRIFNQQEYELSRKDLLEYLGNNGFAKAQVTWKAVVNRPKRTATVKIMVSPDKRYRFGPVSVKAPENIDDKVIKSRITFKEGEFYSSEKVKSSQRNIFGLGCFNLVSISPLESDPAQPDILPMEVLAKPKKKRAVMFGIGWGTEDKLRVKLGWEHRNFWGQARNFSVTAKYSSLLESLEARLLQPYFFSPRQYLEDNFGYRKDKLVSFTNEQLFNNLVVTRKVTDHFSLNLGHKIEYNRPTDVEVDTPFEQSQQGEKYFISAGSAALQYDTRDDIFSPKSGCFIKAGAELATEFVGSEIGYLRLITEARRFFSLPHEMVFAGKLIAGTIEATEATDDVPIFKRFFSGGSNSVRGYDFQKLGPKDSNGDPIGGNTLLEGSAELRYPIWKKLRGVVFVDFGQVHESAFSIDLGDIRYTSGFGLRYPTPIGPIRIDIGYQLNPQDEDTDRYQVHISIGQAF